MRVSEKYALCKLFDRIGFFDDSGEALDPITDTLILFCKELLDVLRLDYYDLRGFYEKMGGFRSEK